MIYLILSLKVLVSSNMNPASDCLFKVNNSNKVLNLFTVNNKDTRKMSLTLF